MTPVQLSDLIVSGDVPGVLEAVIAEPSLISAATPDGDTPLHIACWQKQVGIVGSLMAFKPDVNSKGCYGRTPLHYAVHEGSKISVPIVSVLVSAGANPEIRDENGYSAIDWAKIEMHEGLREVLALMNSRI